MYPLSGFKTLGNSSYGITPSHWFSLSQPFLGYTPYPTLYFLLGNVPVIKYPISPFTVENSTLRGNSYILEISFIKSLPEISFSIYYYWLMEMFIAEAYDHRREYLFSFYSKNSNGKNNANSILSSSGTCIMTPLWVKLYTYSTSLPNLTLKVSFIYLNSCHSLS